MKYVIIIAALMLAGCNTTDPRWQRLVEVESELAQQARSGKITWVEAAKGLNERRRHIYVDGMHPAFDAVFVYLENDVAKQIDAGTLTEQQASQLVSARLLDAAAHVKAQQQAQSKQNTRQFFEGLSTIAVTALGVAAVVEQNQPVYVPPAPPQTINVEIHEKPQPARFPRPY